MNTNLLHLINASGLSPDQLRSLIDQGAAQGPMWWMSFINIGCLAGFSVVFIWLFKNQNRLADKLEIAHKAQIELLVGVIKDNTAVQHVVAALMNDLKEVLRNRQQAH